MIGKRLRRLVQSAMRLCARHGRAWAIAVVPRAQAWVLVDCLQELLEVVRRLRRLEGRDRA